ncbi:HEAT repeat domain-containing protein [Granulosicoccus antarcticus]|uniref:HEAT repeat domain-containing protein n=1 Tax=Granulosicoccus antarcticus IMCC3135 TaxID=1192854 RepID=A0A2Z2NGK4_9GAMM|nr:HEAT repeat domain-containing protein [Granulosicoccus antarcticus]ASJ70402.1 hypothetical protein IMCC3135_01415 [Granulosicoccus antarcticus IMCC3135]
MSKSLMVAAGSGLVALAVTLWLWHSPGAERGVVNESPDVAKGLAKADSSAVENGSPFSTVAEQTINAPVTVTPQATTGGTTATAPPALPALDVSLIAQTAMSDADYEALVARLKTDPALLLQLVDEFRQEQNPERLALLARLLGEAGGADVTQLASELIFSGNDTSRELGLQILRQVQPGNTEARSIASGLLATEVEPKVLMSTLTVLASPGTVDEGSRALLGDQVALLASHENAGVRGVSLDILSRWSTDGRDTPVLINALQDPEPRVRESAAYALVGHEDASETVIQSLLIVLRNADEQKATRRAALMALRSFALNAELQSELQTVERELDTVIR